MFRNIIGRRPTAMFADEVGKLKTDLKMERAMLLKPKTIVIKLRRGVAQRQEADMKIITDQLNATKKADTDEQTLIQSAIAVGYANAMRNHNLIAEEELEGILGVITETAEENRNILQNISRSSMKRAFWKKVQPYG